MLVCVCLLPEQAYTGFRGGPEVPAQPIQSGQGAGAQAGQQASHLSRAFPSHSPCSQFLETLLEKVGLK